jgi:hypothetical protein
MPGEVGAKLVAVVGLNSLDDHWKPLPDLVEKGDRVRDRAVRVDPEDAIAGGLVHRGELIEPPASKPKVFDIDLDGLPAP